MNRIHLLAGLLLMCISVAARVSEGNGEFFSASTPNCKENTGVGFIDSDGGGTLVPTWNRAVSVGRASSLLTIWQGSGNGTTLPALQIMSTMGTSTARSTALTADFTDGAHVPSDVGRLVLPFVFFAPFEASDRLSCGLSELELEAEECPSDSTYQLVLKFQYDDVPATSFKVFVNGEQAGTYPLSDLPLVLEVPVSSYEEDLIGVCLGDMPDCCEEEWVSPPSCVKAECPLDYVDVVPGPCTNDSFLVHFYFGFDDEALLPSDSFTISDDYGVVYGTFAYADYIDGTLTLGPLPAGTPVGYEFEIRDLVDSECEEDFHIAAPMGCIDTIPCTLSNVEVELVACPSDLGMTLHVEVEADAFGEEEFSLLLDSTWIGSFPLDSLPIAIPDIPWPANDTLIHFSVCLDAAPDCCIEGKLEIEWCDDPVWPGDANNNNASDLYDLLHLGLSWGATGAPRALPGTVWQPWAAPNWSQTFADGTNYKHADCNGDGLIDIADTIAISKNYGLTHDVVIPLTGIEPSLQDPAIWAELPDGLSNGMPFNAPIMIGQPDNPVDSIYGIAFLLFFDPEVVDPLSADVVVDSNTWLGTPGVDLVSIDRSFAQEGILHVAITRTDQQNVTGFGQAANFIGFIDDIWSKQQMSVSIGGVRALTASEVLVPLQAPLQTKTFGQSVVTSAEEVAAASHVLRTWPNPADTWIYLSFESEKIAPKAVELWSVGGHKVADLPASTRVIDVSDLPAGVYLLRVITSGGTMTKRVAIE